MKKAISLFWMVLLTVFCAAAGASGEEYFVRGDYEYILLDDGTAEITQYNGTDTAVVIPETLDGHTVTSIGDYMFASHIGSIVSVCLPDTVTAIGTEAFSGCSDLAEITLPGGLTSIGKHAFSGCRSLTKLTLPDSLIMIGPGAFGYGGFSESAIPDSVRYIGNNPFYYCWNLERITVSPDHPWLEIIDGALFSKENRRLICYPGAYDQTKTSFIIPEGTRMIGGLAFYGWHGLTEVVLPDSVTDIGVNAFTGCDGLTEVTIPAGVVHIERAAFSWCENLKQLTIPGSVTSVGDKAFFWCSSLTDVVIEEGVTSIGEGAFHDCHHLKSITIPDSVTSIGKQALEAGQPEQRALALDISGQSDSTTWIVVEPAVVTVMTVGRDSYAMQYCIDNGLQYIFADGQE